MQDANASLMEITPCLLQLGSEIIPGIAEAEAARRQSVIDKYSQHLREWVVHWERWCATDTISWESLSIFNVQLWFTCAKTLVKTGFRGPETRYDNVTGMFRDVVGFSEKLSAAIFQESGAVSLSLDLGYMIPTFFVSPHAVATRASGGARCMSCSPTHGMKARGRAARPRSWPRDGWLWRRAVLWMYTRRHKSWRVGELCCASKSTEE